MPGFIDPHSHVTLQSAKFSTVNLDPHPIGDVRSIADIQRKLKEYIEEEKPEPGRWVFGWGYDDTGLEEMRHPNRDDLDAVSTEHPILLIHISAHFAAVNSKALEVGGITADMPDPAGGVYQRKPGSQEPNGVMEENAWIGEFLTKVPLPSEEKAVKMMKDGLAYYAAAGICTACDGASSPGILKLLRGMEEKGQLPIDIIAYPAYTTANEDIVEDVAKHWKDPGRFRLGGLKLILDGSIQGYTAFLTKPYYRMADGQTAEGCSCDGGGALKCFVPDVRNEEGQQESHAEEKPEKTLCGYSSMTPEQVEKWVRIASEKNFPLQVHCNGDAAVEMLLDAADTVYGERPRPELRNSIIHCQCITDDQLNRATTHGFIPSFFPIHVLFWGDRHRDIFLGPKRAARIDPARSALDRGLKITLHHDAPVAGIGMLPVAAAAVNRRTTSGKLLGPDERITPYEALRAITKDAAWQYFEAHRKGTLELGKLADMVILDADPLAVDPKTIGDIQVLETIKEGRTVYRKK